MGGENEKASAGPVAPCHHPCPHCHRGECIHACDACGTPAKPEAQLAASYAHAELSIAHEARLGLQLEALRAEVDFLTLERDEARENLTAATARAEKAARANEMLTAQLAAARSRVETVKGALSRISLAAEEWQQTRDADPFDTMRRIQHEANEGLAAIRAARKEKT